MNERHQPEVELEERPMEAFAEGLAVELGEPLAEEIHRDPEARKAMAAGAGIGVGAVVAIALLNSLSA